MYKAPALTRGLKILELMSLEGAPQTLKQIAEKLDVNTNYIFRHINVLVEAGYVNRCYDDQYQVSGKIHTMGMQYFMKSSFSEIMQPFLKDIADQTRQSCHCGVRFNNQMVIVSQADSPENFGFSTKIGYSKELEKSNSGKIILAYLPSDKLDDYFHTLKENYDDNFINTLRIELKNIKKQGYLAADSMYVKGIKDLIVPVLPLNQYSENFSIGIPFINSIDKEQSIDDLIKILLTNARKIAQQT